MSKETITHEIKLQPAVIVLLGVIALGLVLIISGCSAIDPSGPAGFLSLRPRVTPFGPDTYTLQTGNGRERGIREANLHCNNKGLEMMPVREESDYFLIFRCLESSDSELQRPVPRRDPDVLMQDSR